MNGLAVTGLVVAGSLAAGALVALLTQPRHDDTDHLARVDTERCLCCGPTDHSFGRRR